MKLDIAVIGAGPAGLGAGRRLAAQSGARWAVFEAAGRVGGLSSSRVDKNGFTWDLGGHVIFSREEVFIDAVQKALGPDALSHTRKSFIRMAGRFIPFPLQNNIHRLPPALMRDCLRGLESAAKGDNLPAPAHFGEWIGRRLGEGLARHFMLPYNTKLWAYPLEEMNYAWIDGRVSLPPVEEVRGAIEHKNDNHSWGPNSTFHFPRKGGTGGLFANIAKPFIDRICFRHQAVRIDWKRKTVLFKNGFSARYGTLITTAPLDILVNGLLASPPSGLVEAAALLQHNAGYMVGIGVDRAIKADRCWVYFPGADAPFYRVTYFSNYSPLNVPRPGTQTSFMCEISSGPALRRSGKNIVRQTVDGLVSAGLIRPEDRKRIASTWSIRLPYLYPIPTLRRDEALGTIHAWLDRQGIFSVGRFGGWRYERGNMDHSFMAGHRAAEGAL